MGKEEKDDKDRQLSTRADTNVEQQHQQQMRSLRTPIFSFDEQNMHCPRTQLNWHVGVLRLERTIVASAMRHNG